MRVTVQNILHPLTEGVTFNDKKIALIQSIVLGILTLGIIHLIAYCIFRHRITLFFSHASEANHHLAERIQRAANFPPISKETLPPVLRSQPLIDAAIDALITRSYSQEMPKRDRVTVEVSPEDIQEAEFEKIHELISSIDEYEWQQASPGERLQLVRHRRNESPIPFLLNGSTKRWVELSKEQKVAVINFFALSHNQADVNWSNWRLDLVFFGDGPGSIPGDSRTHHGCDHASRASLWAGVFGYLYLKYSPLYAQMPNAGEKIALAQLAAAAHDMGRQAEGPDVFDRKSAEGCVAFLAEHGIEDASILADARSAIAHKDASYKDVSKSFLAKCVQCADCADFARLTLSAPEQSEEPFSNAIRYLDIYNEMRSFAMQAVGYEVAAHSDPHHDYSDAELAKAPMQEGLTFGDFMFELNTLRHEMNEFIYLTHQKSARSNFAATNGKYHRTLTQELTSYEYPALYSVLATVGIKKHQLPRRAFDPLMIRQVDQRGLNDEQRQLNRLHLEDAVAKNQRQLTLNVQREEMLKRISENEANLKEIARLRKERQALQKAKIKFEGALNELRHIEVTNSFEETLHTITSKIRGYLGESDAAQLFDEVRLLMMQYEQLPILQRDPRIPATCALAIETLCRTLPEHEEEFLNFAVSHFGLDELHPLSHVDDLLEGRKECFLHLDGSTVRRGMVQVCKVNGKTQLNIDLRSIAREKLERRLVQLGAKEVPTRYAAEGNETRVGMSKDWLLTFPFAGHVEVRVGKDSSYWSEYGHLRLTLGDDQNPSHFLKALSWLGIPTALQISRPEDLQREALARIIAFRFPKKQFDTYALDPEERFEKLTPQERSIVEADIAATGIEKVGDHFEVINPRLASEAWEKGARAFGVWIGGGTFVGSSNLGKIIASILKGPGLISTQDRYERGLFSEGTCPTWNIRVGSGNQVFTRLFSKGIFERRTSLHDYPNFHSNILFLFDVSLMNRMPYSYLRDRAGLRSRTAWMPFFAPSGEYMEPVLKAEMMRQRASMDELIEESNKRLLATSESMFNHSIPPQYLRRIVVPTFEARRDLMVELRKEGIDSINGVSLDEVIIASDHLSCDMIDHFHSSHYLG